MFSALVLLVMYREDTSLQKIERGVTACLERGTDDCIYGPADTIVTPSLSLLTTIMNYSRFWYWRPRC